MKWIKNGKERFLILAGFFSHPSLTIKHVYKGLLGSGEGIFSFVKNWTTGCTEVLGAWVEEFIWNVCWAFIVPR